MHPFTYVRARELQAAAALAAEGGGTEFIAGGTDMLQLLKDDVRRPTRLVDLSAVQGLDAIDAGPGLLRLGALAKMSDVAQHPGVSGSYPVIAQALLASASPQVRNMATVGGNLLQRTRCPYFRDLASACNKRAPGSGCAAIGGYNRSHAILGVSRHCIATHPSDMCVALAALDASVHVRGPRGERTIAFGELHTLPGDHPEVESTLAAGELITAVSLPAAPFARRSRYVKLRDRAAFLLSGPWRLPAAASATRCCGTHDSFTINH